MFMREVGREVRLVIPWGGVPNNSGESSQTKGNGGHGIVDMSNASMDTH